MVKQRCNLGEGKRKKRERERKREKGGKMDDPIKKRRKKGSQDENKLRIVNKKVER